MAEPIAEAYDAANPAAENNARQKCQRDRKPRIQMVKFHQQCRETARRGKDAADRKVDFYHRDEKHHAKRDDADQRRLPENRLD